MKGADLTSRLEPLHADGYGWALACCSHDPDEAREVLQVTYLKILSGKASYDEQSSLKTWFFAVIRNTAADRRRSRWLAASRLARWWGQRPEAAPARSPEDRAFDAESARTLEAALRRLSRRQQEILHLVFYQELTIEAAAGVLGIGVGSARQHYERGKSRMREMLPQEVRP
jgi:RNA polymerase sigma factor (sigma-70 family)